MPLPKASADAKPEQTPNHLLDLALGGGSRTDQGLLDRLGGELVHGQTRPRRARQCHASGLPEHERRARARRDEHLLHDHALRFVERSVEVEDPENFRPGARVYLPVEHGEDGFARLAGALHERPDSGAFIKARVSHVHRGVVSVQLPFDRYYADENLAPELERAYRERARDSEASPTWVAVRVLDGTAVLEELHLE